MNKPTQSRRSNSTQRTNYAPNYSNCPVINYNQRNSRVGRANGNVNYGKEFQSSDQNRLIKKFFRVVQKRLIKPKDGEVSVAILCCGAGGELLSVIEGKDIKTIHGFDFNHDAVAQMLSLINRQDIYARVDNRAAAMVLNMFTQLIPKERQNNDLTICSLGMQHALNEAQLETACENCKLATKKVVDWLSPFPTQLLFSI